MHARRGHTIVSGAVAIAASRQSVPSAQVRIGAANGGTPVLSIMAARALSGRAQAQVVEAANPRVLRGRAA